MPCCILYTTLTLTGWSKIHKYIRGKSRERKKVERMKERKKVFVWVWCVCEERQYTRTKIVDVMCLCTLHINWTHIGRTSALESYASALASITIYTCMDFLSILFPSMLLIVCYAMLCYVMPCCVSIRLSVYIWSNFQKTYQTNIELGLMWSIPTLVTHSANALIFSNIIQCASLD